MLPTFLAIGHFCYDVTPDGYVIGGPAAYAAITARNLGYHACAVTAVGTDFDRQNPILDGIDVIYHQSPETTIFDNRYDADGRRQQRILGVGGKLQPHHIPSQWKHVNIAYLCPVADEVNPVLAQCFNHSLIGVTPQGWMRRWGESRHVHSKRWHAAEMILPYTDVLVLSDEDSAADPEALGKYIQWTQIVVLTKGKQGATVYENGQILESVAYPAHEVDPTGAGDVFATAFLIKYHETQSSQMAVNVAHCAASFAVEGKGTANIPTRDQVNARLRNT
ncbi:MAG: PfkB family carbohydrate kinase [Candidatus Poribacteria bacterium]|nr:PfkB family carbohydrate kinase [Candidatus Poribacteria bacterium]